MKHKRGGWQKMRTHLDDSPHGLRWLSGNETISPISFEVALTALRVNGISASGPSSGNCAAAHGPGALY